MICFNYHFWRVFTLLLLLAGGGQSWAASMPQAVDVAAAAHRLSLNESMV
jgi:hypothetical protein